MGAGSFWPAHLPAFHNHFLTAHNTQFHHSPLCSSVLTCLHSINIFSLHTIQVHHAPLCSNVLTCLHSIAIFSLHTIQALCFSNFSFESHFFLSFSLYTIHALCFSNFFFESHFFVCLSHHGTFSRAKFPNPDDDGFKLFTSLVYCASHNTSGSTQIQERLERWFYNIVDGFVWGEVSCQ